MAAAPFRRKGRRRGESQKGGLVEMGEVGFDVSQEEALATSGDRLGGSTSASAGLGCGVRRYLWGRAQYCRLFRTQWKAVESTQSGHGGGPGVGRQAVHWGWSASQDQTSGAHLDAQCQSSTAIKGSRCTKGSVGPTFSAKGGSRTVAGSYLSSLTFGLADRGG